MFYPSLDFSLGLSNPVICHKPPESAPERKRKGKAITGHSKRVTRSACHILEERHGRQNLAFITLTLPALNYSDLAYVNRNFSEAMRQFCQELARELKRCGLSEDYVCITEIQEKRWLNRGEIALHAHILCQGRHSHKDQWKIRPETIRKIWERVLANVLCRPMECPAATRIERVRKSAKRYLGKYMSKGGKVLREVQQAGLEDCLPPSWVRMSNALRKEILASIVKPSQEAKDMLIEHLENYKGAGIIRWFYKHYVDLVQPSGESFPLLVSVSGEFASDEVMKMFSS